MSTMTNGVTITVIATGKSYHSLRDCGLAIGNNNCIGTPVQETFYLDVPGADGFLDYSEALTGRPIFKQRPIEITLGGKMDRRIWNSFISSIRILLHGKRVRRASLENLEIQGTRYFLTSCDQLDFKLLRIDTADAVR